MCSVAVLTTHVLLSILHLYYWRIIISTATNEIHTYVLMFKANIKKTLIYAICKFLRQNKKIF